MTAILTDSTMSAHALYARGMDVIICSYEFVQVSNLINRAFLESEVRPKRSIGAIAYDNRTQETRTMLGSYQYREPPDYDAGCSQYGGNLLGGT